MNFQYETDPFKNLNFNFSYSAFNKKNTNKEIVLYNPLNKNKLLYNSIENFSSVTIEEIVDNENDPNNSSNLFMNDQEDCSPIIEEFNSDMENSVTDSNNNTDSEQSLLVKVETEIEEPKSTNFKYSDYVYKIEMKKNCAACKFDSLTLIKENENMFHSFLNTDSDFQKSMFCLLKNVIQNI